MKNYPPYPAYKDSGVEWLGQVPEHWEVTPIGRFTSHNDDVLSDRTQPDQRIRYVDISSVNRTQGILGAEEMQFGDAPSRARRKVRVGDVVVSTVRTYLKAIAAVDKQFSDCVFSTGFAVLRAHGHWLNPKYLKWLLLNDSLIQAIEAHSTGVSYPAINAADLVKLKSVIPPLAEQAKITAQLDKETTRIDALLAKKTRFIELLQEKRQALVTHAVTRGLNPDAPMKDSGVEWIGEVPAHWSFMKIAHGFTQIGSGATPPSGEQSWYTDQGTPWVTTSELRENVITKTVKHVTDEALQQFSALRIYPPGSLLIAMYGATIGRLAILGVNASTNQACCVLSGPKRFNTKFIFYWMFAKKEALVNFYAAGGGQPNINKDVISSLRIPAPSVEEQAAIAEQLDEHTARIDTLITKTQRSIELLQERRAALITAAVTGQIDLREAA